MLGRAVLPVPYRNDVIEYSRILQTGAYLWDPAQYKKEVAMRRYTKRWLAKIHTSNKHRLNMYPGRIFSRISCQYEYFKNPNDKKKLGQTSIKNNGTSSGRRKIVRKLCETYPN